MDRIQQAGAVRSGDDEAVEPVEMNGCVRAMSAERERSSANLGEDDLGLEHAKIESVWRARLSSVTERLTRMLHTLSSSRPRAAQRVCRGTCAVVLVLASGPRAMLRISSPSSSSTPPSESLNFPFAGRPGVLYTVVLSDGEGPTGTADVDTDSRVVGSGDGKYIAWRPSHAIDQTDRKGRKWGGESGHNLTLAREKGSGEECELDPARSSSRICVPCKRSEVEEKRESSQLCQVARGTRGNYEDSRV